MDSCNLCGLPISFQPLKNDGWLRLNPDGRDHRETCPGLQREMRDEVRDLNHEKQVKQLLTAKPAEKASGPERDFRITAKWLLTAIKWGAINTAQAKALNLDYPPLKGWKARLIGTLITERQKAAVESAGSRRGKQAGHRRESTVSPRITGTQPSQGTLFEARDSSGPPSNQATPASGEDEGLPW